MSKYHKPLPAMTELSRMFYDGCKEGNLLYQACTDCNEVIFFPKALCPNCMGRNLAWKTSAGKGKIYSFTVTYEAAPPEFMPYVPFVLAVINMDEGFTILSNIEDCVFDDLHCEMPVVVKFDPVTPEVTLPKFIPADESKRCTEDASKLETPTDGEDKMTFTSTEEIFETLPKIFQPDAATGLDAVFQYDIAGDGGGQWYIVIKSQSCEVVKGTHDEPNVTMKMADTDWIAMCNGELDGMAAFMNGKLKADGNVMLGQRIPQLFPMG